MLKIYVRCFGLYLVWTLLRMKYALILFYSLVFLGMALVVLIADGLLNGPPPIIITEEGGIAEIDVQLFGEYSSRVRSIEIFQGNNQAPLVHLVSVTEISDVQKFNIKLGLNEPVPEGLEDRFVSKDSQAGPYTVIGRLKCCIRVTWDQSRSLRCFTFSER